MERTPLRALRYLLVLVCVAGLGAFLYETGFGRATPFSQWTRKSTDERLSAAKTNTADTVTTDMQFEWVCFYRRCGHTTSRRKSPTLEEVGMTLTQFQNRHKEYHLEVFPGFMRMDRALAQCCPAHLVVFHQGDILCVYQNTEGENTLSLQWALSYSYSALSPETQKLVQKGMLFDSREAIAQFFQASQPS